MLCLRTTPGQDGLSRDCSSSEGGVSRLRRTLPVILRSGRLDVRLPRDQRWGALRGAGRAATCARPPPPAPPLAALDLVGHASRVRSASQRPGASRTRSTPARQAAHQAQRSAPTSTNQRRGAIAGRLQQVARGSRRRTSRSRARRGTCRATRSVWRRGRGVALREESPRGSVAGVASHRHVSATRGSARWTTPPSSAATAYGCVVRALLGRRRELCGVRL